MVSHRTFRPTWREWRHVGQAATPEMLAWQTSCATPNFMARQYWLTASSHEHCLFIVWSRIREDRVKPLCKSHRGQSKVTLQATMHPPDPERIRSKPRLGWIPSAVPPYWPWHIALAYPISSWHVYEAHRSRLCWPAVHMILAVVVLLLATPKSWACQLPRHHGRCNGSCHAFDPPWTRMLHGTHSWHGSNHLPRP